MLPTRQGSNPQPPDCKSDAHDLWGGSFFVRLLFCDENISYSTISDALGGLCSVTITFTGYHHVFSVYNVTAWLDTHIMGMTKILVQNSKDYSRTSITDFLCKNNRKKSYQYFDLEPNSPEFLTCIQGQECLTWWPHLDDHDHLFFPDPPRPVYIVAQPPHICPGRHTVWLDYGVYVDEREFHSHHLQLGPLHSVETGTKLKQENIADSVRSSQIPSHSHQMHVIWEKEKCTNKWNDKHEDANSLLHNTVKPV